MFVVNIKFIIIIIRFPRATYHMIVPSAELCCLNNTIFFRINKLLFSISNLWSGRNLASLIFSLYDDCLLILGLIQSLTGPCAGGQFWPRESHNLIGPLTIGLSTEVNCLRDSLTVLIWPPSPRNKSAKVNVSLKDILVILGIVMISFSPENGVRFDVRCLSLRAEKCNNSDQVRILFYRIVSRNFHLKAFSYCSIENINRVVVVSTFYETKRTAEGLVSFAKEWSTSQPIIR